MWLINARTLHLEDFYVKHTPPYAILSHTWGSKETSFAQLTSHAENGNKIDDDKIIQTCRLALEHGLEYAWVDTCCIDKRSSAELSEAINSMYRWYQQADICFVYLEDLPSDEAIEEGLGKCRWPTRGWTLQELIAPSNVKFYDSEWRLQGHKSDLQAPLARWTNLPGDLLLGRTPLEYYAVASRMSWASRRNTTRIEDVAYSLLGVFDVNMPLLYGEGEKAFQRLQEEIIKKKSDLSILGWAEEQDEKHELSAFPLTKLFARSPAAFRGIDNGLKEEISESTELSITQRGLIIINDEFPIMVNQCYVKESAGRRQIALEVRSARKGDRDALEWVYTPPLRIPLRQTTSSTFARSSNRVLPDKYIPGEQMHLSRFCLTLHPTESTVEHARKTRRRGIHVPEVVLPGHHVREVCPKSTWDVEDNIFLPARYKYMLSNVVAVMLEDTDRRDGVGFIVLIDRRLGSGVASCKICRYDFSDEDCGHETLAKLLFYNHNTESSPSWDDLETKVPEVSRMKHTIQVRKVDVVDNLTKNYSLHADVRYSTRASKVDLFGKEEDVSSLIIRKHFASYS